MNQLGFNEVKVYIKRIKLSSIFTGEIAKLDTKFCEKICSLFVMILVHFSL